MSRWPNTIPIGGNENMSNAGWNERKSVSDLTVLGDDEGQVKTAGGLLAAVRQDTMYPSRSNYELVQQNGESIWLAGSASLGRQLGPTDIGHFVKCRFEGWGTSPNGKYKVINVQVFEGELTDAMKAWPRFAEVQAALKDGKKLPKAGASASKDEPPPDESQADDDDPLPF